MRRRRAARAKLVARDLVPLASTAPASGGVAFKSKGGAMLRQRTAAARLVPASVTILAALVACVPASAATPLRLVNRARPAAAVTRPLTTYGGSTSQDAPFALQVARNHKTLVRLIIHAVAKCPDGTRLIESGPAQFAGALPTLIQANTFIGNALPASGRFRFSGLAAERFGDSTGALDETITGRVTGARARGTYRMRIQLHPSDDSAPTQTCDTGALTWKADASPGRVFAGLTAAGRPVVIKASADRRRVSDARISWSAPCDPSGGFAYAEHFGAFPMSATGHFGDAFDQHSDPGPDGSTDHYHYDLRGTASGRTARGTFAASAQRQAADGTPIMTCTMAAEAWTAKS
jgi:hypothetical protein